jgi:hypothetical protein
LDEKLPPIDEAAFNEEAGVGMYDTHTIKDVDPSGALTRELIVSQVSQSLPSRSKK